MALSSKPNHIRPILITYWIVPVTVMDRPGALKYPDCVAIGDPVAGI